MSVVQRRVVLTAPNPPAGFPGSPLESPSQPLTVAHLIAVNHYIKQLGLFLEITPTNPDSQTALAEGMLHQSRVVNAIVRDRYPEDLRDPGSQAQNNELALKIAEMVTAQMRPQLDELKQEFGQGKKELEGRLDRVDKQIGEMNKRLNGFDNRLESVNTRFDEVNKRFDKRFDDVDKRFDDVDKRFDDVDKRFDDVDKRFDDVDKRFDDVDKRFDDVYKRFDGVDKRFNDVDKHSNEVDKRFNDVSNRFDNVDQRSNDLNEQLTGLSSSLETTKADLIEQVSGVTQRLEGLEQATSDLRGSLELLSGNQDIRVVIKEVLDKELDEMKSDIRANTADLATLTNKFAGVEDLPGMEAAVHESQGQLKNLLDRVTRIERSNRLFVNHTRIADGPWVEIPNEEGKYPTNSPEKYKLLANNRALESLTGPALGKYLTFYALPFPTGVDDMTPRWSSEQKAEATSALRVYITSPA